MAAFCDDHWRHSGSIGVKELMIAVERVVRPVQANPARKMKMRQELLTHLTSAYDEGLARLGNEGSALEEAVRRFGNPTDLTRDLQASVPFFERVLFAPLPGTKWTNAFDRYMEGKQGEPPSRRLVRWAWLLFLSFFALSVVPAITIYYQARHDVTGAVMAAEWLIVTAGTIGVFLACVFATFRALSGSLRFMAVLGATVFAALAVVPPAVASAAMLNGMLDMPIQYGSAAVGSVVPIFLILAVAYAARFQAAAKRSREEWTKLEIGE
jgi:hypothetical protein